MFPGLGARFELHVTVGLGGLGAKCFWKRVGGHLCCEQVLLEWGYIIMYMYMQLSVSAGYTAFFRGCVKVLFRAASKKAGKPGDMAACR